MLKDRSFLVFVVASVLACIPLTFYFSFTNAYLNEVGVPNAAGKMTLGQVSEIVMMLLMPWIYRRIQVEDDSADGTDGLVGALSACWHSATPDNLVTCSTSRSCSTASATTSSS